MNSPPTRLIAVISRPATASPRTNLAAPSIAPKKPLSASSVRRRSRAVASSISPADRSASIAICLPGIASSENRAATSAMRPEPLVITTKFTTTRMPNTITPITTLPCMMNRPNDSITCPAAAGPSWPWPRISRVEARLSDSRSMVAISSTVGKALNSSGFSMNSAVTRISTESVTDKARQRSRTNAGSGRISTTRIASTPQASSRSPCPATSRSCGSRLLCSPASATVIRAASAAGSPLCGAVLRRGLGRAGRLVLAQLVAQRPDRDPQDGGRVRAVAQRYGRACRR